MSRRRRPPHGRGRARALRAAGPRRAGLAPWWLLVSALVPIVATLVATGLLALVLVAGLLTSPGFMTAIVVSLVFLGNRRRRRYARRLAAAGTAPLPHRPAPPPRPDRVWWAARARFATLRSEYAAHECDPMAVLRLPALSDVTVPSTARFVDAFAEAQALETDAFPPETHATAFVRAVERAERSWRAARDAAERIRLSGLDPAERRAVERVIKLLTTARDSDSDAERVAAYARARSELARLDRLGVVHVPHAAQTVLAVAGRGQLPA